jgi:hypothetical protein
VLATLNQLKESFLKAHKAGDVENAKILAAEIRRLQQTTPAQPAEVFGIPPQQLTQDLPEPPPAVKPLQEAFKYVYGRDVEQAKPIQDYLLAHYKKQAYQQNFQLMKK